MQLRAHFLDLRGVLLELRSQLRDSGFQCLYFAIKHGVRVGIRFGSSRFRYAGFGSGSGEECA